ncbi:MULTISPECIES: methylenetetrahydrofolate reductase [NAD(P)H] [unclassified Clostridium]|uniref:methylenetetrahydrofolate reductase [NAD(P)H] n=1 Tax=Clostridium TaxID=1485 RepID=UPI001C8B7247|nr:MULTISPECIES: methylenetetrahydrofolate reductase [NAD(P)H] [unclassified Clostridium]MBX9138532.1 methylenetetrahydrofolate reductase [NAD(P)H] [Clostridium sp. K12(2020)]MBX9145243.1 methylenetetrahydrofolate reductase [NAD(P)H] [Clostridium sp. K13]MDU2288846.1 methylenetetrahydrofolate reductase [NAD(P)H] [Clostridium celatum]MDU4325308.1 methylenetetrahydrofolate reductase [NAD(P)H] [Clostridium celatum]
MKINELFNSKELVFSFEIFPPKVTSPISTVYKTLEELNDLKPDFISVTYGAGGSLTNNRTTELSSLVKEKYGVESVAHLTCISSTKDEIDIILDDLKSHGIENILALRGDIPVGQDPKGEFNYAYELISHIKKRGDFNILGACYPEGHVRGRDLKEDMMHLKLKEEMGATHFISQLFFDNNYFYDMLEEKDKLGIKSPIQAGIMPVVNKNQIERISSLCGAHIPEKFIKIMNKYEHDKDALREAGIAYAVEQIVDLVSSGVDGIHLYTMNNPYVARRIHDNINTIINSINNRKVV